MADVEESAGIPRIARVIAWCGAGVGVATVVLYRVVLDEQGDADGSVTTVWTVAMLLPCVVVVVATWLGRRTASVLLGGSSVVLGGLGLLAIFSVGLGFLLAGVLVLAAAVLAQAR